MTDPPQAPKANSVNWRIGQVKTYDVERGFGFIYSWGDQIDLFVHISKVAAGPISEEDFVIYDIAPSRKKPGTFEAINVHLLKRFKLDEDFLAGLYGQYNKDGFREELIGCLPGEIAKNLFKTEVSLLSVISQNTQYSRLKDLHSLFVLKFKSPIKKDIQLIINDLISKAATIELRMRFWLEGIYTQNPTELEIDKHFQNSSAQIRLKIFGKAAFSHQKRIISLLLPSEPISTIEFIVNHIAEENNVQTSVVISTIHNKEFWVDKSGYRLFEFAMSNAKFDRKEMVVLFVKGYVQDLSPDILFSIVAEMSTQEVDMLFRSKKLEASSVSQILDILFEQQIKHLKNVSDNKREAQQKFFDWFFKAVSSFAGAEDSNRFEQLLVLNAPAGFVVGIWEIGQFTTVPREQIASMLWEFENQHKKILEWCRRELLTLEIARDILSSNIRSKRDIKNRREFYGLLGQARALTQFGLNGINLLSMVDTNNKVFLTMGFWIDGINEEFNFDQFKLLLPFLSHDDQIKFVRKVFWLANKKTFNLTVDKLKELVRIDFDIFQINEKFHPEIPLDISVDIVIEAIIKYAKEGTFIFDSELLGLVIKDINADKTFRFEIRHLFESCSGRMEAKYNWRTNGTVRKVSFGDGQFYFAIEFKRSNEYGGGLTEEEFERIKGEIKNIPGRKWNSEKNHWGVPSKYQEEVFQFARLNRFFLDFEGSNYSNNTHLVGFTRGAIPGGIKFCEGRLAKVQDQRFQKTFWWCCNQPCFENCESLHEIDDWQNYSFLDFIEILGLDVDDRDRLNERIDKGKYYQFISLINRFNRLLERLYCESCGNILSPVEDSNYAHYRAVRFHCVNKQCDQVEQEIYLHHCLNGKCNGIIDSRVSKKCPNGLFICSNTTCGCCCSHSMFERRQASLLQTTSQVPGNLVTAVREKKGHLERAEHYCFRCGLIMREIGTDLFECSPCSVKYNVSSNNFKRPHRSTEREKPPEPSADNSDSQDYF